MKLDFNRGEAWTMQMANMVKQWWSVRPGENWKSEASPMEIIQRVKPGLTHLLIEWSGGEILTLYIIGSGEERWWREEGGSRLQIDACIRSIQTRFCITCTCSCKIQTRFCISCQIQTRFCIISWPTIQNHLGNQHCTVISPFKTTIANGFKWCINLYEKGTKSRRVNVGKSTLSTNCMLEWILNVFHW